LASDPTRKIPNTDHAKHALTETSHASTNAANLEQRQHGGSGIDPINRAKKIHLADVDSIMTQDTAL